MSAFAKEKDKLEKEIVSLLQAKDTRAVHLLTQNYSAALNGVVLRIVRDEELAREVLQDVFVKIWQNASKYQKGKGRLFTWMVNIARNTAIDTVRSARYNREAKTDELKPAIANNERWSAESDIRDTGLRTVINSLDKKQIQVIDLVYFQGYTHSEIAKEFDIPLGTVKSRLRLAMVELRKKLTDEKVRDILLTILIIILFTLLF
ncbi:MAG: sigma-70 family RNA polymerase sigma factor [Bacteroidota bacterium]